MVNILVYGDVYGRVGRFVFEKQYTLDKKHYQPDFTIVNIENITSGRGPITQHAGEIAALGVNCMTLGDHAFDNMPNIQEYFQKFPEKLLRPANFYESPDFTLPGKGVEIYDLGTLKIGVMVLLGEVFIGHKVKNPFFVADEMLQYLESQKCDMIVCEFHKEATAEFYGLFHYLKERVHFLYGTHTHIQTNDARIWESGVASICDIGMCGPRDGVIGAEFSSVKYRFLSGIAKGKIEQKLDGQAIVSGIFLEFDPESKKVVRLEPFQKFYTL